MTAEIQTILQKLSLTQKCALLSGADVFKTRAFPHEGVPSIWLSDGPHGVRKQAGAADHLGLNPSLPATCFPTAASMANSWDETLGEEIGTALGEEAAAQRVCVLLGPGLNIKRSPLCGRNFEYFSEDPYLAGKMAASYIRGMQSKGISACPKHFAVNGQELRRMATDSVVDERTLREIYLTGFEIAVKEGHPHTIMSSYNKVNGTYANENAYLLQQILRREWGFDGMVVTDWGGSNDHALGVKHGSALEMPAPGGDAVRELLSALKSGKITQADIDARLEELLSVVLGTSHAVNAAPDTFDEAAHHALARRAAGECAVLLKNEGGLLPLRPEQSVALIGDFAETPRYQGAGSSVVNVTRLDTLKEQLAAAGVNLIGYAQGFERHGAANDSLKQAAAELAKKADIVLLCLGLDEIAESEGLDRSHMRLAQNQIDLLELLAKTNPNIVALLHCGSAVETPWLSRCKALVWAALGGQAGAGAMADILIGEICPSGKLAETWPVSYEDTPAKENFGGSGRTVEYREGLFVGYRYYQAAGKQAAFPFGYGLSYTEFAYSGLIADAGGVTLTVTNTGSVDGAEIVQLYVAKPDTALINPKQQLKGFARVELAAGESKTVTIKLDDKAYRYWNVKTGTWEIEGGSYELRIGASCEDIRLTASVNVAGTGAPDPYAGQSLPHYRTADVQHVPDEEFEALLGRHVPSAEITIDRNLTLGEMNHGRSPLGWLVWLVLDRRLKSSIQRGEPDLNTLFQYNMPLRAIAKMTNGLVSMGMVDGIVMELKGYWLIGIVRVIYEFVRNTVLNAKLEKELTK